MAFVKLAGLTSKGSQKPFYKDWVESLEEVPVGATFICQSISTNSLKGMILDFEAFCLFIYKSQPHYDLLKEAVEQWLSKTKVPCLSLCLADEYGEYDLGLDNEVMVDWYAVGKGKFTHVDRKKQKSKLIVANPFLVG